MPIPDPVRLEQQVKSHRRKLNGTPAASRAAADSAAWPAQHSADADSRLLRETTEKHMRLCRRHRGISIWRDHYDRGHWLVILPFRWIFHVYDWRESRRKHFYLIRRSKVRTHINHPYPEFKRKPW